MASDHFTIPTRDWDERSYLQGTKIASRLGVSLSHEADPDGFEVHVRTLTGKDLGKIDIPGGGHSSAVGLEQTSANTCNLYFGHEGRNSVGFVTYKVGQTGVAQFTKIAGLPLGDASVDQTADLLCIRSGNRYRGFRLSAAKVGKIEKVFDFSVPGWGNRFQGHLIDGGRLYVHRDIATKAESRVHVFDLAGKPITVDKGRTYFDTTHMGDEAEGLCVVDRDAATVLNVNPGVYVVKRTGGTGPGRVFECTRVDLVAAPPQERPLDRLNRVLGPITKFKIASFEKARIDGYESRYSAAVQGWLGRPVTTIWTGAARASAGTDQAALDAWRHKEFPTWPASDYTGEVGPSSINRLVKIARAKGLKVYPVVDK